MSQPPEITVPQEVLDAFGFQGATCTQFERGAVNRTFKVEHSGGVAVLRRGHISRFAPSIAWEQTLIEHAASKGWPVPLPIASSSGATVIEHSGRRWTAAQFLEGDEAPTDRPSMHHIMGRLLGRLHRDLVSFDDTTQRPGFGKSWELDSMVTATDAPTFNALLTDFGKSHPELAAMIRRHRYQNLRELARLHYPDLPEHPIHGDFQPWNLLFSEGNLTGLLDFDWSRRDAQVADLTPVFCTYNPLDIKLAKAFLEGYEAVRPLSDSEWDLLPALVRAELLRFLTFRLVEWKLEGPEGPIGSITRTTTVRFPAFDATVPAIRALRTSRSAR